MSWIVNILATLIYLGFGIIYAVDFSKRKHFRYSIVVTAAAIFLTQAGMFLLFQVENWFGAMMWMSLGYVLMMLSLWVNVKNDDGGRILLCSMGILYLVSCL